MVDGTGANGAAAPEGALMVELDEVGGEPVVFEVERVNDAHVAVTLTMAEPVAVDGEPVASLRFVALPEDLCHEIDKVVGRPPRPPVVNPALAQEFTAPFDVVLVARHVMEISPLREDAGIEAMGRRLRAVKAIEQGRGVFDLEATVMVPNPAGSRGWRAGVRGVPGPEVTVTGLKLAQALLGDVAKALRG